jgi:hypothetical protein
MDVDIPFASRYEIQTDGRGTGFDRVLDVDLAGKTAEFQARESFHRPCVPETGLEIIHRNDVTDDNPDAKE